VKIDGLMKLRGTPLLQNWIALLDEANKEFAQVPLIREGNTLVGEFLSSWQGSNLISNYITSDCPDVRRFTQSRLVLPGDTVKMYLTLPGTLPAGPIY
jgi:hypothetical protein